MIWIAVIKLGEIIVMKKSDIFCSIVNSENRADIKEISMNSKDLKEGDLFVAIRGGNTFVGEALGKGAYVVYDNEDIDTRNSDRAFLVKDSVGFLQEFARKWRENLHIKIIGITGSNGKTTVKDMIFNLLSKKYRGKKTEGNYNNHIGLPFTLLRSEEDDEFMILEMGMSGFGEIDLLGKISSPDIAVITNIGESHLEFLKTKENVFKAKAEIVPHIKDKLIINGDDEYLKNIKPENVELIKALKLEENYSGGNEDRNFCYGDIDFDENGAKFLLKYFEPESGNAAERSYSTNVLGEHNILNLTMAIAVAKQFGMEDRDIREAVKDIALTDMRFQKIEKDGAVYINDAYNASPMSMRKSLETFSEIYNDREKVAVLADMLELGEDELPLHEDLAKTIKNTKIQRLYLFGPRMKSLYRKMTEKDTGDYRFLKEIEHFENKEEIKKRIDDIDKEKAVLIKGSRGMKLEEVI